MKTLFAITFFLFLISSCRQEDKKVPAATGGTKWSQDSIKQYFKDSIAYRQYNGQLGSGDSLNNFDTFSRYILTDIKAKNISDPFILAFEENYIDTSRIEAGKQWFRITVDPVFRIPYCLILEKVNNKSILTLKMTDGYGGYYSGYLNFTSSATDSGSLYNSISSRLHQLNFWEIKDDTTCSGGGDGEVWTFEGIEKGQYNLVSRWFPLNCGDEITQKLALIGVELRNRSLFKNYLQAKTEMTKKKIEEWYPDK